MMGAMGSLVRLFGIVSLFWILSSIQNTAHASSAWASSPSDCQTAARIHSDLIQIQQHPQKDVSKDSFSGPGAIGPQPDSLSKIVLTSCYFRLREVTPFKRKVYLFFPTGLSPPLSSIS